MAEGEERAQHLYKVIVIGDYAVGKTSLIKRYTEGYFTPNYKLTIGVDFAVKAIEWDEKTTINLQLWDIGWVVFDLQRPATFDAVLKWREDVNNKVVLANDEPIPCLLLANKCDIPGVVVDTEMLDNFCQEHNFIGWYQTSAADNTNVDEAMKFLIGKILEVAKTNVMPTQEEDTVDLAQRGPVQEKKKNECCPA